MGEVARVWSELSLPRRAAAGVVLAATLASPFTHSDDPGPAAFEHSFHAVCSKTTPTSDPELRVAQTHEASNLEEVLGGKDTVTFLCSDDLYDDLAPHIIPNDEVDEWAEFADNWKGFKVVVTAVESDAPLDPEAIMANSYGAGSTLYAEGGALESVTVDGRKIWPAAA